MSQRTALVTGITGQDGSYLAELLLSKGYQVYGLLRRVSTPNLGRIEHLRGNLQLQLRYGDLCDSGSLIRVLQEAQPDEVYNLAAMSHVQVSFKNPEYTGEATGVGAMRLLEALRDECPGAKFYQASSSEMFGSSPPPQNESTLFHPRSPYGVAKLYAYWAAVNYRESYNLHVSNGILFNHESPRRGESFVTRKISLAVANIVKGKQKELLLGNLDAKRDWGHARDYVEAMWLMLQNPADDFVVATGEMHSIRDFLEAAFGHVELAWQDYVKIDPRYFRPAEVDALQGDATKARKLLGWQPKYNFETLVREMVEADLCSDSEKRLL
jgi:GDPmannose 4,6-dehydratase